MPPTEMARTEMTRTEMTRTGTTLGGTTPTAAPVPTVRRAMVLAAGLGTRMRPLTAATAKPLLPLGGRSLIDHALDRLLAAGVEQVVVNTHWQAERLEAHLRARAAPRVVTRREPALLDTGGAVAAALADGLLGGDHPPDGDRCGADPPGEAFFTVNGDSVWLDGPTPALARLAAAFNPAQADAVLLVHRTFQVHSEVGCGDFLVDGWGTPRRGRAREIVPYVYAGVQLATPALFRDAGAAPFGMNAVWDRAIAAGRLRAVVHDGLWFHLSRPQDLSEAESALLAQEISETT